MVIQPVLHKTAMNLLRGVLAPTALIVVPALIAACASTSQSGPTNVSGSSGTSAGSTGSSGTQAGTSGSAGTSGPSGASGTSGGSGTSSGVGTSGSAATGTGQSGTAGSTSGTQTSGSTSGGSDAGTSDSGATGGGCAGLALCDDFESDKAGSPPNPALWTLYGTAGCGGAGNPGAPMIYPITVDTTEHHSGSQSLKVVGGDSCGALAINTSAMAAVAGEVFARFYVKLDPTRVFHHAVLMGAGLLPVMDGGVGLTSNQASYLELSPQMEGSPTDVFFWATLDNTAMPPQNSTGAATSTYVGTDFTCIEFHVSKSQKIIETWVNDMPITGLTSTSAINSSWQMPPSLGLTSFGLGWLDFNTSTPAFSVWFDDVAISNQRIHCQ
jgi:hypothetical protein